MIRGLTAALVTLASAGCTDAITLEISSNRPIPTAIDSVCVGVADSSISGGHFGQLYRLQDKLAMLPQTLRVDAGGAEHALAWARADRGGVPVEYVSAHLDFGSDVTLALDKCVVGPASAPAAKGDAVGPVNAFVAASHGQGGTLVVAIAPGAANVLAVTNGALAVSSTMPPALPPGNPIAIIAADVDGDCDDDFIIATDGAAPVIWLRDRDKLTQGISIGDAPVASIAAADVDRDGDTDVITGGGNKLALYRNDGSGQLTVSPGLSAAGRASAISALAIGDLDGDGNPDLVVGQAGPPLLAWLGGDGAIFTPADGVLPAVPLNVERISLGDADGDFDPDVAVSVVNAPMRLYIDRDGRLEDQSFIRLPQPAPQSNALAFGGWDAGCEPDAVIAADAGASTLRGIPGGAFEADTAAPAAHDVVMTDLDDDGDLDAVFATAQGVQWLAR